MHDERKAADKQTAAASGTAGSGRMRECSDERERLETSRALVEPTANTNTEPAPSLRTHG